jgi:hypothetical protein
MKILSLDQMMHGSSTRLAGTHKRRRSIKAKQMAQSQDLRYHLAPDPQANESLPVPTHHAASSFHFSGWNEDRIIRGSGLG